MANTKSNELKKFIKQSSNRLKKLLKRLKWSQKETLKNFNTNSKAASTNNESCKIACSPKTTTFPDSCNTKNSIVLATPQLQEVLRNPNAQAPNNFNELQRNFSREEKLKIYDYVIQNTEKLPNNKELPGVEGELSIADILAQKKREDKRKKRKFRKTKPTQIEEVRCLVQLQMQALQQYMGNKIDNQTTYTHTQGNFYYNATNNTYNKDFYMQRNSYQNNERIAEQSNKYTEDFKGCYRIRNIYYKSERRRHKRSRSRERKRRRSRSYERYKDHNRSRRSHSKDDRSREKRKRSHSRSRKRSHSRNDRSRERTRRSHSRSRKRSHSKDIRSKERTKRTHSRSCSNDYKYENKYSRKYSRSPESSKSNIYKQYYDVKYNSEDEKHNKYKFCKHNKRKHKREYT